MKELVQFLEREQIKAVFWIKKGDSLTGVPKVLDNGDVEVSGLRLGMGDFRSIVIVNPDHPLAQEFRVGEPA